MNSTLNSAPPLAPSPVTPASANDPFKAAPKAKKNFPVKYVIGAVLLLVLTLGGIAAFALSQTQNVGQIKQQASGGTCNAVGECLNGHTCVIAANNTVTPTGAACDTTIATKSTVPASAVATSVPVPATPGPAELAQQAAGIPDFEGTHTDAYKTLPVLKGTATTSVSGMICAFGKTHPAGTVVLFDVDKKAIAQTTISADQSTYTIKIPVGKFIALFYPDNTLLPKFSYTQYVPCGMNTTTCTNHAAVLITTDNKKANDHVNLCDPQLIYPGLPDAIF